MQKKWLVLVGFVVVLLSLEFFLYGFARTDYELVTFEENVSDVISIDYDKADYDKINELYDTYIGFTEKQQQQVDSSMQELVQYRLSLDAWSDKQDNKYLKIVEENHNKIAKFQHID